MRALDDAAQAALTAQNRVRSIFVAQSRIQELVPLFYQQAKTGDCASAMVEIRLMEREASMMGLNAPSHVPVVPAQLAREAAMQLTGTRKAYDVMMRLAAGDPQRKMNGGPGYSTEFHHDDRDDEDEKLIEWRTGRGGSVD
jgi:hypothetical protein